MKTTIVVMLSICLSINAYLIKVPTEPLVPRLAPLDWVQVQKAMLPFFENICEESTDPTIIKLSREFTFDASGYLKPSVVDNFHTLKTGKGLLPKGQIFSEVNIDHLDELRIIYELLYNAKDFDTFYKTACWARQNVNCGLFIDAIYLAIINRKDTERLSVPAPYELLPNYFVRKDSIIKASSLLASEEISISDGIRNEGNSYIIDTNYTSSIFDDYEDSNLAYFQEDVGLNSYFFFMKLRSLPWVDTEFKRNNRYGEYLYHFTKQLMARYNLERYSNGLLEAESIDWDKFEETEYDPMLIYSNGNEFASRTSAKVSTNDLVTSLKNIENNTDAAVIHMMKFFQRDGGFSKAAILNNLMDILITSNISYQNLALQVFDKSPTVNSQPSVLEHFMTTIRDPIFWKINKKIVDITDNALKQLPGYTKSQLYFPGVRVANVEVKKMITMMDNFEFDVTDALKYGDKDPNFQMKIGQSRLNHKPFAIKVNVSSLVVQKSLVKLYIGPKIMPGQLADKRHLFMLIDSFEVNLKKGTNIISRASHEINKISEDLMSLRTIHKNVVDSEFGVDALPLNLVNSQIGLPSRLILPKGNNEGLPFQIFVFVAPFIKATPGGYKSNTQLNSEAILSPGYPLDLDIEIQELFNLPNALVKDIVITHKGEYKPGNYGRDTGDENTWQNYEQDINIDDQMNKLSLRPEFTKKREQFDYKSKKGQYGKKEDYANKRVDQNDDAIQNEVIDLKKEIKIEKETSNNDNVEYTVISNNDGNRLVIIDKDVSKKFDVSDEDEHLKKVVVDVKTLEEIELENNLKVEPIQLRSSFKKQPPTIFNIIFKTKNDTEHTTQKIYE
ncbi:hexamerin-like isoform X1 [Leptidea sinapis]|uniref:hexamerin-like isoform X1 n=2 Tax=Leptidea sinapis TaxID=189913 RepID=UPI002120EBCB|nr:hexamerin-like isoform X1 [Leptidea sinapis]